MVDPAYLVGAGGVLGALARTLVGEYVVLDGVPASTFAVNVLGTFLLAALTLSHAGNDLALFLGTGFCGSFTTFSSFSVETVRLWETGEYGRAAANALGTLAAAGVAVALAALLVGAL